MISSTNLPRKWTEKEFQERPSSTQYTWLLTTKEISLLQRLSPSASTKEIAVFLDNKDMTELGNITVCDKFEPLSLEGQLFYSLNVSKHVQKQKSNSGKANGLVLLLDSDPFQLNIANKKSDGFESEGKSFKVFIHTLAQYSTFGSGSYELSSLKRMTGTESFKELPDNQKECTVLNREECQNQKFLDAVQKNRKCIPWILQTGQSKIEVRK